MDSSSDNLNFIACAISCAWLEKTRLPSFTKAQAESFSFVSATRTVESVVKHLLDGGRIATASFTEQRRLTDLFASSQLIALDIDQGSILIAELLKIGYVRDYALLIYHTPSSTIEKPRIRLFFMLEQPITDANQWKQLARGLYEYFKQLLAHVPNLEIDPASYKAAQAWSGSLNRTEQPYINYKARLPMALIPEYIEPPKPNRIGQGGEVLSNTDERARRIAEKWLNNSLAVLTRAASGRRNILLAEATKIGGLVKGGYITSAEAERGLMDAATACGLLAKLGEREVIRHIEGSFTNADATIITLPEPRPKRSVQQRDKNLRKPQIQRESITLDAPATLAAFTPDRTISSRYIADAPGSVLEASAIALKSPTNSGKSRWAAASTADAPSLLTIAFRTAIVKEQAGNYGAMVYDDLAGVDSRIIASADRVSTTIDSLYRFGDRIFHTIVIDEWVSGLGHFSSAGTLKEKGAGILDVFKRLIVSAARVIVMDATLTDDSLAELKALRGDLVCVENTYVQPKAPTQILPNRLAFFSTALSRVGAATLPVLLGVTSPSEARLTKDLIADCYPEKRVRVVTVKQSHLNDTQAFIRAINTRLSEVDVLIFNGAMSTGVSIDTEVDSIICLIDRPLSPADGVQMLGRARNTQTRFARVPDSIEGLDHDAAAMFQTLEYAAQLDHVETTKQVRDLARLRARHEARRNVEMSDFMAMFRAYCHADGSDTQTAVVRFDKAIADKIKAIREAHTAQKRTDTLDTSRIATITPEILDGIREAGEQEIIPEIDAGYLRHKIETATGQPINEVLYDKYRTKQARAALRRADISSDQNAPDIDRRENAESLPLHQRTHASGIQNLFRDGLRALGAKDLDELPKVISESSADAFADFGTWATRNVKRFEALLGYRGGHDGDLSDDVKAVRYFLKRFGVTLDRKRIMRDGQRFYVYSVDAQQIAELNAVIAQRRLKAAEAQQESITPKRQYKRDLPFWGNSAMGTKAIPKLYQSQERNTHLNPFGRSVAAPVGV